MDNVSRRQRRALFLPPCTQGGSSRVPASQATSPDPSLVTRGVDADAHDSARAHDSEMPPGRRARRHQCTDAVDAAEDLLALTTIAAVKRYFVTQAGARLAQSIVSVFGSRVPTLVGARGRIDLARLRGHLAIGGLFATLGVL